MDDDTFVFQGKQPGYAPQFFVRGYDESGPGIVHFELDTPGFVGHAPHPNDGLKSPGASKSWGWGEDEPFTVIVSPEPFDLG